MTQVETFDRAQALEVLVQVWPQAKLGRVSNDDLLFLLEIAMLLRPKSRGMAETLNRYRTGYEDTVSYSNRMSKHNGDPVAKILAGLSPTDVLVMAEDVLGLERGELIAKYERLNPGQQRMNAGNRIRAAVKRGEIEVHEGRLRPVAH